MQRDMVIKGRGLGGSSDLTLLAAIKPGFAESLESVTYKTRVKRVLEALHGSRKSAHEYASARLLSDAVERVGVIHSVRVAVLEPEDKVLLTVTFDGNWESYIRVLWDRVGTLLDLIFCSTVDYVTAYDHSFEEWLAWGRRVQVETGFFYGPPQATAHDVVFHRRIEQMRMRGKDACLDELRAVAPSASEAALRLLEAKQFTYNGNGVAVADEPAYTWGTSVPIARTRMTRERMRNGLRALAGLYQLADLFRPGTADGEVLRLAATDLLAEFLSLRTKFPQEWAEEAQGRFQRQIAWLFPAQGTARSPRSPFPPPPDQLASARLDAIQGGILSPFEDVTHGLVVFLQFRDAEATATAPATPAADAAAKFFQWAHDNVTSARANHKAGLATVFRSVAVTPAGLRACGLAEEEIELFPEEFRQGMAARADTLGDVRHNHPKRWLLPPRWGEPDGLPIDLDSVHAVLVLRTQAALGSAPDGVLAEDPRHPLAGELAALRQLHRGIEVLAAQGMERRYRMVDDPENPGTQVQKISEHFGYADGNGQPEFEPGAKPFTPNLVHLGEMVHGYPGLADPFVDAEAPPPGPQLRRERQKWLQDGSFLVIRKYQQFVRRLETAVEAAAQPIAADTGATQDAAQELVYAKLMGRARNGAPLAPGQGLNNFLYRDDPVGAACPLHAHIRMAHPRERGQMARPPRIMRRGMSYGPAHVVGQDDDADDRGMVFMAYNASISEQFEVVQRWLTLGNSTGASSGRSCPILGVADNGLPRHFAFEHGDAAKGLAPKAYSVQLEAPTQLFDPPAPVTRLHWGLYLFTPSLPVLGELARRAGSGAGPVSWSVAQGRQQIAGLQQVLATQGHDAAVQAWKVAIEDPVAIDRQESAGLWAAIRQDHGGLLRTPYGTIVASRELLHEVFSDRQERYSVSGQMERMKKSFGPISLGLDAGKEYDEQADDVNKAIRALTRTPAQKQAIFEMAFHAAARKIGEIVQRAKDKATSTRYEATFDAREVIDEVLADLSEHWFGLQDGGFLQRGGADLTWTEARLPLYPGHFTALSRYMFQPHPGAMPQELGQRYGQALRKAVRLQVKHCRDSNTTPQSPLGGAAPIAANIYGHALGQRPQPTPEGFDGGDDFVARMIVGVLMGFNPTIIGATLNVLREWQRDGSIGALRAELGVIAQPDAAARQRAGQVLAARMRAASHMRPMPQIAWRTVRKPHRLAAGTPHAVDLVPGDVIVLGIVSGTQQSLADQRDDGLLMFGGDRRLDPHPTHACPGYEAGIEAMLGALAAILSRPGQLQNGFGWLNFLLEGDLPMNPNTGISSPAPAPAPVVAGPAAPAPAPAPVAAIPAAGGAAAPLAGAQPMAHAKMLEGLGARPTSAMISQLLRSLPEEVRAGKMFLRQLGVPAEAVVASDSKAQSRAAKLQEIEQIDRNDQLLLCWGDSWFAYELLINLGTDLHDCLQKFRYRVPARFCSWYDWRTLETMAASGIVDFCDFLTEQFQTSPFTPKAIVLSGGGNDAVGAKLRQLLKPRSALATPLVPADAFKTQEFNDFLDQLQAWYAQILTGVQDRLVAEGKDLPIVIHGYDHPYPNRLPYYPDITGETLEWMWKPFFQTAGYDINNPADVEGAHKAMAFFIDGLNDRQKALVARPEFAARVRHVDLTGTLAEYWDHPIEAWSDGLHPSNEAFRLLASKIDDAIQQ